MERGQGQELPGIAEGLQIAKERTARLPLKSVDETKKVFSDVIADDVVPNWMRLLANFPVAGKRQVSALLSSEKDLDLSELTRARLAWVIARQNGAWYSLAESDARLIKLGQTREQILLLENFEEVKTEETLTAVIKHCSR